MQASRLKTQKEQKASLKDHFQFSTLHATWILKIAAKEEWGGGSPEAYLEEATKYMYAVFIGSKAGLRPITKLSSLSYQLAKDIRACPCKTIIPLYRHHVFAQIKLSTCIDLGRALSNLQTLPRLVNTRGI